MKKKRKPISTPRPAQVTDKKSSAPIVDFKRVFEALRAILRRHPGSLAVLDDTPIRFCLGGRMQTKLKSVMPVAWTEIGKTSVSFHHMGVYVRPELLAGLSKELKVRMQGKSCFNFRVIDEKLAAELEQLTVRGFEAFRLAGYMK